MSPPPPLPPIATQPLSVVLIAHNAALHVESLLDSWASFLDGLKRDYEILLIDDGSSDDTVALAERMTGKHHRIRVESHPGPRGGEGAALRYGVALAQYPLLFYAPCVPGYRPAYLGALLNKPSAPLEVVGPPDREIDHVHLLTGYRAGEPVPAVWRVLGTVWRAFCAVVFSYPATPLPGWLGWRRHAGRLLVRALFGVRYHDVSCPCRLLRREIFARIPIQSDSAFAHVEVLAKANFLGCVMGEEVPLDVKAGPYRQETEAIRRDAWRVLKEPDFGPPHPPTPSPKEGEGGPDCLAPPLPSVGEGVGG